MMLPMKTLTYCCKSCKDTHVSGRQNMWKLSYSNILVIRDAVPISWHTLRFLGFEKKSCTCFLFLASAFALFWSFFDLLNILIGLKKFSSSQQGTWFTIKTDLRSNLRIDILCCMIVCDLYHFHISHHPNHFIKYSWAVPPKTGAQHRMNHAKETIDPPTTQKTTLHMSSVSGEWFGHLVHIPTCSHRSCQLHSGPGQARERKTFR